MSRQSEIGRMADLVAAVRGGRSRSLVVVGPAGIGKSWLCRRASGLAEGFTVARTRGVESETHLDYSGLFDVLRPLLAGHLERLLATRAAALRGALRMAEAARADAFAVAVATLDLLALAAEDAPVLIVVDDAPWVDAASLGALRFAARRLDADRVAVLFAARTELASPFLDAGMDAVRVGGLDIAEAAALVHESALSPVADSVAHALAEAGRGDPRGLREAARELSREQLAGTAPLTDRFRAVEAWRRAIETARGGDQALRLGLFACWIEDYDTARRELESAGEEPAALSALGELEFRVGDWLAARAHAEAAMRLDRDCGHIPLMLLAAVAGEADGARTHADILARAQSPAQAMQAHAGRGLLALGLDDPEAAITHLARTRELARRGGFTEPNQVQWMPDLIESQIRAGREHDARHALAEFEEQAERTGRGWALAAAARCRGLLARPATADAVFREAHTLVAAQPSPFERARTELCWGERLRRDGHRVAAREHLHDALARFQALGATPWAGKAARELRSSGGRALRGPRARSSELTPQQLQIATMVTEGRTNRNIADSLFLSPKTIEFHLGHVYRKLDVSNRTQLTRSLLKP